MKHVPVLALILLFLSSTATAQSADKTGRPGDATTMRGLQETATATSPSRDWDRVSVRLSGGLRWLRGGDVNDGVEAWAQVFESSLGNEVVGLQPSVGGDVAALRRGAYFGVDVLVHLTSRVAIVAGVGRVESSSAGTIERAVVYEGLSEHVRNSTSLGARAIPIRVGAQYSFPLGRRVSLGVEGGVGLYFTDLEWSHALGARGETPATFERRCIPPERRCSSVSYGPICSLVAPCQSGASPLSVRRGVSPRAPRRAQPDQQVGQ